RFIGLKRALHRPRDARLVLTHARKMPPAISATRGPTRAPLGTKRYNVDQPHAHVGGPPYNCTRTAPSSAASARDYQPIHVTAASQVHGRSSHGEDERHIGSFGIASGGDTSRAPSVQNGSGSSRTWQDVTFSVAGWVRPRLLMRLGVSGPGCRGWSGRRCPPFAWC